MLTKMAWGKAGSTTLDSAGNDVDITSLSESKTRMIMSHMINSGACQNKVTFNDTGSGKYATRNQYNDDNDSTENQQNKDFIPHWDGNDNSTTPQFVVSFLCDVEGAEKLGMYWAIDESSSAPKSRKMVYKFIDTPKITRFDLHNQGSGSYNTGSNLSALGSDITPAAAISFPTNVQVGSRAEITDTRKMYSYNEPDFNKTDCVGYYTLDEASGNPTNHVTTSNGFTDIPTETIYYLSHGHDSTGRHFVKKVGSTVTTMTESDYINLKGALTESHKGSQTSALPSAWSGMWQGSTSAINGHDWYAISFSTDTNSPANGSSGATQNVTGKFDKCFEFSGGNNEQVGLNGTVLADYYNPSNHASTTHKSDFTISCWINHDNDNGNYPMLVANYTGSNTGGFQFYINGTANTVTFWTSTNDVTASGALSSGSWHHVVCMRESGTVKFYINGSLNSSTIANAHHIEGLVDCAIGGKTDGGNGLNGKIDEVSIWRRALSASEISALYNSGTGKTLLEAKQAPAWKEIGA